MILSDDDLDIIMECILSTRDELVGNGAKVSDADYPEYIALSNLWRKVYDYKATR